MERRVMLKGRDYIVERNWKYLCIPCSEGFMHTRMRRRVESLIQELFVGSRDASDLMIVG
ncbi:hypothetical protein TSUD_153940 [Trifolium subterraneum]|uniref:Uncharacterized protein n=1 Tax=Trifolium subterraneum TaxID=3900 RepID=A0A2Z6N1H9_TRISU|nr:hypothetical protein TSUD_153940 [Trifolium subterraneum]